MVLFLKRYSEKSKRKYKGMVVMSNKCDLKIS